MEAATTYQKYNSFHDLHVAEGFRRHVARMGIERGQHAVDRRFDQFRVLGLLDIVRANPLEYVAK